MAMDVTIGAAFLAGILSFLSPCVLPLVPPYLCYITGYSLDELSQTDGKEGIRTSEVAGAAVLFILGFSTVFVMLGATASAVGQLLREHMLILGKISGVVIILMGLHFVGLLKLNVLYRHARVAHEMPSAGLVGAYLIGLAFAFGWTPCIGPVLAAILAVAAGTDSVAHGAFLLAVYSAGLGVPFLAAALFLGTFFGFHGRFRKHVAWVEKVMGVLLIGTGVMFLTGSMQSLSYWLLEMFPGFATIG